MPTVTFTGVMVFSDSLFPGVEIYPAIRCTVCAGIGGAAVKATLDIAVTDKQ